MIRSFFHSERVKAGIATALTLFAFISIWLQSRGNIEGGQDSWNHYLIARYAPVHPELFLHQWGKPLFTTITTLFCQLGFNALLLFNITCTLLTGYLCYLCARKLNYNNAWLVIIITCFCPILMGNTISGLTEPLNAVLLALVMYLWLADKKAWSVLLASFLPFVRSEGFVIISAIFLFLLVSRHVKYIPLLFTGFVVYSLIGKLYYGTWNWVFGGNPYIKAETENAAHQAGGAFMHYLNNSRQIWGILGLILLVLGIIALVIGIASYFKNRRKIENGELKMENENIFIIHHSSFIIFEVFFISGIFVAYLLAHSYIYWKGMLGSEGLLRVMAVIVPCTSLLALKGWNFMTQRIAAKHFYPRIVVLLAIGLVVNGYKENHYATLLHPYQSPVKPDIGLPNYRLAENWIREQGLADSLLIHQMPRLNVVFDKDPDNIKETYFIWSIDKNSDWTPKNAIVIWDGYYSSREGRMPLNWLMENPSYELLKVFKAQGIPKEFEGAYDIYIFRKK